VAIQWSVSTVLFRGIIIGFGVFYFIPCQTSRHQIIFHDFFLFVPIEDFESMIAFEAIASK